MTIRIFAIILLLVLTLPLSVVAMGTTDNPEAELKALIASAEKEVAATLAWHKADKSQRQRLSEEAVRKKIISTVQSRFGKMSMAVDRKFDLMLDKSLGMMSDSRIPPAQKERIRELFKEEQYKHMYRHEDSQVESAYETGQGLDGQGVDGNVVMHLMICLKNNTHYQHVDLEPILRSINQRMGKVLSEIAISDLKYTFIYHLEALFDKGNYIDCNDPYDKEKYCDKPFN